MCGDDVGLDKFNPTYFLINGVHNGITQTDKRTVTKTTAGKNVLVRLANASYSKLHVTLDIDAWIVEVDGRPLRTNAAKGAFAKPKLLPKGTKLEVAVAQRYALWIPEDPARRLQHHRQLPSLDHQQEAFRRSGHRQDHRYLKEATDHADDGSSEGYRADGRTGRPPDEWSRLCISLLQRPSPHDGHDKPAHADAAATAASNEGHASGHGARLPAKPEEDQAGGHGGGYGAHSGWPEPKQLGGDFSLTDHTGRKVTLADFKGKATAFYFGYTQCGDICPIIGTKLGMAVDLMGDKADQVNIAMVSVDDRNDGPEQLAAFVAKQHPRLIGLSGTRREIYDIAARYRVRRDYVAQNQVAREGEQPSEATMTAPLTSPDRMAACLARADAVHGLKVLPPGRWRPSQRTLKRRRTARASLRRASGSRSALPPTMRRGCTTWRWRIPRTSIC